MGGVRAAELLMHEWEVVRLSGFRGRVVGPFEPPELICKEAPYHSVMTRDTRGPRATVRGVSHLQLCSLVLPVSTVVLSPVYVQTGAPTGVHVKTCERVHTCRCTHNTHTHLHMGVCSSPVCSALLGLGPFVESF